MSELRPYQADMIARTVSLFAGGAGSVLWQVGTGAGKTHTAAEFFRKVAAKGFRGLFLAHLTDLISDTAARLRAAGVPCGYIQAGRPSDPTAPIQVASIQTITSRGLSSLPPAHFVGIDEAHRSAGPSARAILEAYPDALRLGMTATPQRGDGQALGGLFRVLVQGPSNRWLTEQGYLVPCDVLAPGNPRPGHSSMDPVKAYQMHAMGRRAIVFSQSIEEAKDFVRRVPRAALFVGDTGREERERLKHAVRTGKVDVLVGVSVFVEGFDLPELDTVIQARDFTVTGAYLQSIGRGLRPAAWVGKTRCKVIDLWGSYARHGLVTDDRRWSLEGSAVTRETVQALCRCAACYAIFPAARQCPRCGETIGPATLKTKAPRRTKEQELELVSSWPEWKRDAQIVAQLRATVLRIATIPAGGREAWVHRRFRERFGRTPTTKP